MKENKKLVLIGGGGHCKSVLDAVIRLDEFSEVVITDYDLPADTMVLGHKVVGNDEMLSELFKKGFKWAFVTVGSIKSTDRRREIFLKAQKIGFNFPVIIDSSAVVSASALIGPGVYIGKNAVVNADVIIGEMAIINTGAIVEHDCRVGEFTHIAVGAVVCGGVEIENDVFVGANATFFQNLRIGPKSVIGAGSVVLRDVKPDEKVYGIVKISTG